MTIRTAILIDGGFYRKRAYALAGDLPPKERADELEKYCYNHVRDNYLYRIFYYDCPPLEKQVFHPLTRKQIDYKSTLLYKWTNDFFDQLKRRRKFALRMGKLEQRKAAIFRIKESSMKRLLAGTLDLSNLQENDFELDYAQKGVDMRIGIDIASLSHKKQVDQIILISGDSDFVPAAKHARREGIDFILDPMGQKVTADLFEHIDGLQSYWKKIIPKIKESGDIYHAQE